MPAGGGRDLARALRRRTTHATDLACWVTRHRAIGRGRTAHVPVVPSRSRQAPAGRSERRSTAHSAVVGDARSPRTTDSAPDPTPARTMRRRAVLHEHDLPVLQPRASQEGTDTGLDAEHPRPGLRPELWRVPSVEGVGQAKAGDCAADPQCQDGEAKRLGELAEGGKGGHGVEGVDRRASPKPRAGRFAGLERPQQAEPRVRSRAPMARVNTFTDPRLLGGPSHLRVASAGAARKTTPKPARAAASVRATSRSFTKRSLPRPPPGVPVPIVPIDAQQLRERGWADSRRSARRIPLSRPPGC